MPFLDVLIKSYETSFDTTTFYKKTYTGLLTHFSSFTSMKYKVGLVRTLVDRAFKINSSYLNFHKNLEKIKHNLQKNGFPLHFIERIIQKFMSSKFSENEERANQNSSTRFYKLPFLGESSSNLQSRFRKLVSRCCTEDTDLKLIFVPSKISNFFNLKDPLMNVHKSFVVYKFVCPGCSASYVGETARHFSTRINEHLGKDKNSHVFKHLENSIACKENANFDSFVVLDTAPTKYQLRLKEGLYIDWLKPQLNKQVKSLKMSLLL